MTDARPEKVLRLFFGFDLPRDVGQRAAGLRTMVDDPKKAVRWIRAANLHLTVRFLGATPQSMVSEIVKSVGSRCAEIGNIGLRIEKTGVFPQPTRPRVLWLGVTGELPKLKRLEADIHQAVEPLGYPREERDFVPHIALGRIRYVKKVTPDVTMYLGAQYEPVDCVLKVLHLYESSTGDKGVIYTPLASFPLEISDQEHS
ncbi:MAG: RNA 2',3'-cyclic phosphodiesterase [Candidatus Marinimicrobia bacterium]|nr:RNA 2',3'-cyclic phosphodiesterase [Candidatus Neomarinimicrobiota bacterium]